MGVIALSRLDHHILTQTDANRASVKLHNVTVMWCLIQFTHACVKQLIISLLTVAVILELELQDNFFKKNKKCISKKRGLKNSGQSVYKTQDILDSEDTDTRSVVA